MISLCLPAFLLACLRGWRNAVELALFDISSSMKPYPSVLHAYTSKLKIVIDFFEPQNLDEVSNRIPPTPQCWFPASVCHIESVCARKTTDDEEG